MTKKQQIKEMAKVLENSNQVVDASYVNFNGMAKALVKKGYGNLREFAEKLKDGVQEMIMEDSSEFNDGHNYALYDVCDYIDNLLKEYEK